MIFQRSILFGLRFGTSEVAVLHKGQESQCYQRRSRSDTESINPSAVDPTALVENRVAEIVPQPSNSTCRVNRSDQTGQPKPPNVPLAEQRQGKECQRKKKRENRTDQLAGQKVKMRTR